jgi:hypothetical protein
MTPPFMTAIPDFSVETPRVVTIALERVATSLHCVTATPDSVTLCSVLITGYLIVMMKSRDVVAKSRGRRAANSVNVTFSPFRALPEGGRLVWRAVGVAA